MEPNEVEFIAHEESDDELDDDEIDALMQEAQEFDESDE